MQKTDRNRLELANISPFAFTRIYRLKPVSAKRPSTLFVGKILIAIVVLYFLGSRFVSLPWAESADSIFSIVVGFIFLWVGPYLVYYHLRNLFFSFKSSTWPTTDGKITEVEVVNTRLRSPKYRPRIKYSYKVGSQLYSGERISFVEFNLFHRAALSVCEKYRPDTSVMVYYNPSNPHRSVLEKGQVAKSFAVAFAATLIAVGLTLYSLKVLFGLPLFSSIVQFINRLL